MGQNDTPLPLWYNAVISELARLDGHWKQEPCILGIIDRETNGEPWDTPVFWQRPTHPNRNTFYKWMKSDPIFADVLESCRTAVRSYRRERAIQAIDEAELIMQEASPDAARALVKVIDSMVAKNADKIRAANSLLDRASASTANKQAETTINLPSVEDAMQKIYGDAVEEEE